MDSMHTSGWRLPQIQRDMHYTRVTTLLHIAKQVVALMGTCKPMHSSCMSQDKYRLATGACIQAASRSHCLALVHRGQWQPVAIAMVSFSATVWKTMLGLYC